MAGDKASDKVRRLHQKLNNNAGDEEIVALIELKNSWLDASSRPETLFDPLLSRYYRLEVAGEKKGWLRVKGAKELLFPKR